ncbi:MAG: DUF1232 domain-containing protein [Betaproteobacteria bacterium]
MHWQSGYQALLAWAKRLRREAIALWFAVRHPGTPWLTKLLCAFIVAYALSPIDLIPDFIPVLGLLDEALLLPGLIWLAIKAMPPDLMAQCRLQADDWLAGGGEKPRSWLGAAIIVFVWLAAAVLMWRLWAGP